MKAYKVGRDNLKIFFVWIFRGILDLLLCISRSKVKHLARKNASDFHHSTPFYLLKSMRPQNRLPKQSLRTPNLQTLANELPKGPEADLGLWLVNWIIP